MKVGKNQLRFIILLCVGLSVNLSLKAHAASINWTSELPENVYIHRSQAGVLDDSGWTEAVAMQGSFEVRLPFKFEEWSVFVPEYDRFVHSIGGTTSEGIRILVSEFPNFDGVADFNPKTMSSKLLENTAKVRMKHFKFKGLDVSQARFSAQAVSVVRRYVVVDDTLFILSIESPKDHKRAAKKLESKFLNSFRMKKDESKNIT